MADKKSPTGHTDHSLEKDPRRHSEILKKRHLNLNHILKNNLKNKEQER